MFQKSLSAMCLYSPDTQIQLPPLTARALSELQISESVPAAMGNAYPI